MSKIIIFFSLTGKNNERAKELADKDKIEILEFSPGWFFRVFQFFFSKRRLARKAKKIDVSQYNEIIFFGPIWAGKPAPAYMALLENIDYTGKEIECNISHTGNIGETENIIRDIITERKGILKNITFITIKETTNEN